jgi:hypothetical protein
MRSHKETNFILELEKMYRTLDRTKLRGLVDAFTAVLYVVLVANALNTRKSTKEKYRNGLMACDIFVAMLSKRSIIIYTLIRCNHQTYR